MRDTKTISMEGSEQLDWDDIDKYAQKHGFNTTSSFSQYVFEKEILGVKTKIKDKLTYIIILMIIVMIMMMMLLLIR